MWYYLNFFLSAILTNPSKNRVVKYKTLFLYKNTWSNSTTQRTVTLSKFNKKFLNDIRDLISTFSFSNYFIFATTKFINKNYKNFIPKNLQHNYRFFLFSSNFLLINTKINFFTHYTVLLTILNFNISSYILLLPILSVNFQDFSTYNSLRLQSDLNLLSFNSYLV